MFLQLLAFILTSLAVIVIPGPDLVLVFKNAVRNGRNGAAYTAVGIMLGNGILGAAAALGLTALLIASHVLYTVIRFAGALYLIYLGVRAIRRYWVLRKVSDDCVEPLTMELAEENRPVPVKYFRQGLISNLLNPKVATFYLALFPQFDLRHMSPVTQHIVLVGLFWTLSLLWYVLVCTFLRGVRKLIASRKFARRTEAVAGGTLIALGTGLLVES